MCIRLRKTPRHVSPMEYPAHHSQRTTDNPNATLSIPVSAKKTPACEPSCVLQDAPRPPCSMLTLASTHVFCKIGRLFRRRHTPHDHDSTLNFGVRGSLHVCCVLGDRAFFSQIPDSRFDMMHCEKQHMAPYTHTHTHTHAHTHTHTNTHTHTHKFCK